MAFTKLFAFAKKKAATQNVQATLDLEGVFAMVEDVHVRMHFNKKGELVRPFFTLFVIWSIVPTVVVIGGPVHGLGRQPGGLQVFA